MQQVFHADKKMSSIPTCPATSLHPPMKDYSSKCTLCHCISLFSHPHSSLHEPGNDNILVRLVLMMNREKSSSSNCTNLVIMCYLSLLFSWRRRASTAYFHYWCIPEMKIWLNPQANMYQNQYNLWQFLHFDTIWLSLDIGKNVEKLTEIWKIDRKAGYHILCDKKEGDIMWFEFIDDNWVISSKLSHLVAGEEGLFSSSAASCGLPGLKIHAKN